AASMATVIGEGRPLVRATKLPAVCGNCANGRKASIADGSSRLAVLSSLTTPTISRQGVLSSGQPCLMRCPIGSPCGQSLRANDSLITVTVGAFGPSPGSKPRPLISRMPMVSKYPMLTGVHAAPGRSARAGTGWPATMKIEFQLEPTIGNEYV